MNPKIQKIIDNMDINHIDSGKNNIFINNKFFIII